MAGIVSRLGVPVRTEGTIASLCESFDNDGAMAVIAEEALDTESAEALLTCLRNQPSWSDFPLILLTSAAAIARPGRSVAEMIRNEGNVTLLERPLHPVTLLSAIESALRARRRQYEAREYLLERERAEEKVRQSQKMDAVGQLAGGVAHEVNNMMTAVIGFGEIALRRPDVPAKVREDIAEMVRAGRRAATITQQLLAFSRQQHRRPEVVDLNRTASELLALLQRLLGAGVELRTEFPDPPVHILADRNQVDQVLINLAVNARDAMPGGGTVRIGAERVLLDVDFGRAHGLSTLRTGPYVLVTVTDHGTGMDAATRERVFEPFFTTKPTGRGTGLGLSTVYGIVKQSDGYIWIYSEEGIGTTVKLYFPEVTESGLTWREESKQEARGGVEVILVVEDEDVVRRLARTVLEDQGYTVLEAEDGLAALELLHKRGGEVNLVLCDTVMPRMNGREFVHRAHQVYPHLPVLFMSGYASRDVADRGLLASESPFLQKPFSPERLARRVRELLDSAAQRGKPTGG